MKKNILTREEIRTAAMKLAFSEGPESVSMRRVAESCGVALGTLYHYYTSKDELINDMIEDFWRGIFHSSAGGIYRHSSFLDAFTEFYTRSAQALGNFEITFLCQMNSINGQRQMEDKLRDGWYFAHIIAGLVGIIKTDPRVKPGIWTETFRAENFVTLLVEEMLYQLKRKEEKTEFIGSLIERIIY